MIFSRSQTEYAQKSALPVNNSMQQYVYTIASPSVLLPHMYMSISIEEVKQYHMYQDQHRSNLPLGIFYAKHNNPFAYGCTAVITSYNDHVNTAIVLGLERFRRYPSLVGNRRIFHARYVFDRAPQNENVWVKQLRIIECLELIRRHHNVKVNIRNIKSIRTPEFSFVIATSQFFSPRERYRLLTIRSVSKRLDIEFELLNSRFAMRTKR